MNYQFARSKKLVGLIAMAMLVTTAGWGLAPATARADAGYRDDRGCLTWCGPGGGHDRDFRDRDFDGRFRDRDFDRDFRDRDFFDHDRDFQPFFPFFFGR
jgi:hypothetical protein